MNNLTAAEKKAFNATSQIINPSTKLGDTLDMIIDCLPEEGTPVNAVAATETLTLTGVVVDGETLTINNPAKVGVDVYEFLSTVSQVPSIPTNIPVNIAAHAGKSTGTLTMDTQPTAGDTVTVGEKIFTFVPVGTDTADGEVSIGADLAGAQAALVAAINGTDDINTPHPLVSVGAFAADDCVITALVGGTAGDTIATTEAFTAATNVFAATTLGSGADCTAANAVTALVTAITSSDTQGVGAADGAGDTVVLTADIAGITGNVIAIGTTFTNGTFTEDAVVLSGGVDGTVAIAPKMMLDENYLYVCLTTNDKTGRNWRRISLGNEY